VRYLANDEILEKRPKEIEKTIIILKEIVPKYFY
jgi:hypothetical protein